MGGDTFTFNRFKIIQSRTAMKVGTDGVLLGAWCSLEHHPQYALDIGTGTGLIALMIAQRGESYCMDVDAVEIDNDSFMQARENVLAAPLSCNINLYHTSLQEFSSETDRRYDLIVSNPPFFVDSLLPPDIARTTARHTTQLTHENLIASVSILLSENGIFSLILPYAQTDGFIAMARQNGLWLTRRTDVFPTPSSKPKRSMMEFGRNRQQSETQPETLVIEAVGRHGYSPEYIELTHDFYLKF